MPFRPLATTLLALTLGCLHAEETKIDDKKKESTKKEKQEEPKPSITKGEITIDGRKVPYKATAGKLALLKDDGTPRATIFHVAYERSDVTDNSKRPVMFAFNGGPGSSAVWLHIGMLGPRIIQLPGDGTQAPQPPLVVQDNPHSLLDVCDLVFVDPVSTGYSRVSKDGKKSEFHGFNEDVESVGDFVRRWITENDRWASPKFLLGESYGGVRVAGLSQHLQSRYGMSLNGVVLLSSLIDFGTLQSSPGNDLALVAFLPTYATVAHAHGKVAGNRDDLLKKAKEFAFGAYATALLAGSELSEGKTKEIATTLSSLTGILADRWVEYDLRMNAFEFRTELLRDQNLVIGRFDARVAWPAQSKIETTASYDPSYSLALGAFSSAMLDYLGTEVEYKDAQPYEILTGRVFPWRWGAENQKLNTAPKLAAAMRDNPKLQVLVMAGHADLATPPEGIAHSLRHLPGLPKSANQRIRTVYFDSGHMFYLNPPDLEKSRKDLVEFLSSTLR